MSDDKNENVQSPNEGTGSTGSENIQRDMVFYYSRERRLEKASPGVRALNDGRTIRPSLSKTLFATRSHKIIFVALILFITISILASRFSRDNDDRDFAFAGNALSLTLDSVDGVIILSLVKTSPSSGIFYAGPVDIAVSPVQSGNLPSAAENASIFTHRVMFNLLETETYHITLPFEGRDFFVVLDAGGEQVSMRLKV